MPDLATAAASFGALLHAGGVPVTPERSARFAEAVLLADPLTVDELYWLARVTLLSGQAQLDLFDRAFDQVFRGLVDLADDRGDTNHPPPPNTRPGPDRAPSKDSRAGSAPSPQPGTSPSGEGREDDGPETVLAAASTEERLGHKDFAACTPEELALVRSLVAQLKVVAPRRPSRRAVRHPAGRQLDVRSTLRQAHRTGGDPVARSYRRRKDRPRRVVLIADVSGSMESYARVYLHLLHGAVRATGAEAFVFATRLTRLTRALSAGHPDVALQRAAATAPDWSGGTRIGGAIKTFNDEHGRRGVARGAVVVIVSDGWECDDPSLLGREMERLARLAHHIVWVNPRKASDRYQPLVGGMAAALPHVDTFVSGHSVRALDDVLVAIRDVS